MNVVTHKRAWLLLLVGLGVIPRLSAQEVELAEPVRTGRVDRTHAAVVSAFQGTMERVDLYFSGDEEHTPPPPGASRLRLGVDVVVEADDGARTEFDFDVGIDLALPRTGRRIGLFIRSSEPDEMADERPDDTDNSLMVGLHAPIQHRKKPLLDFSVGAKFDGGPSVFGAAQLRREFQAGRVTVTPTLRGFWQSDDGFGEVQSVRISRRGDQGLLLQSISSARWTETSEGLEWSQSFLAAMAAQGTFRGTDRGYGIKGQIFGHKDGEGVVDEYRLALIYRFPVWRRWLFIRMGPEVSWSNDNEWDTVPGFRIGLDALFWQVE